MLKVKPTNRNSRRRSGAQGVAEFTFPWIDRFPLLPSATDTSLLKRAIPVDLTVHRNAERVALLHALYPCHVRYIPENGGHVVISERARSVRLTRLRIRFAQRQEATRALNPLMSSERVTVRHYYSPLYTPDGRLTVAGRDIHLGAATGILLTRVTGRLGSRAPTALFSPALAAGVTPTSDLQLEPGRYTVSEPSSGAKVTIIAKGAIRVVAVHNQILVVGHPRKVAILVRPGA